MTEWLGHGQEILLRRTVCGINLGSESISVNLESREVMKRDEAVRLPPAREHRCFHPS